jgi:thiamine pyrophosphate-dependent acetolactate synthase large subunit-like protein
MSNLIQPSSARENALIMNRFDLTKRLVSKLHAKEAVIGGIGNNNFDLWANGQRPENFYMLGSMGLTIPIAFGVALAQPDRRVFALEGDGSLLMQLGALGTVARSSIKNLTMIIFDNGMYQITGKQPTLTSSCVDLVSIAQGSGITQSCWAKDETHFEKLIEDALTKDGPHFIATRIDDKTPVASTDRDPVKIRLGFMQALSLNQ